jgi:hypothetical protein
MKKITVHGSADDNAGDRHPAGTVLTIDDDGDKGCISAKRAASLVAIHSATPVGDKAKAATIAD